MAKKYLDENGLLYFWQKIKTLFVTDVTYDSTNRKIQKAKAGTTSDVVTLSTVATSGSYEDLSNKPTIPEGVAKSTTTPKMDGTASAGTETKFAAGDHVHPTDTSRVPTTRKVNGHALSADVTVTASDIGVEDGAEVNQNAFSNIKVGTTTVAADSKTDTLELVAGSNVTITPDATSDKITIAATDTKYTAASAAPLMDGTAAVGSSAKYAREDHVHPTDTSRQADLGLTSADVKKWNDAIGYAYNSQTPEVYVRGFDENSDNGIVKIKHGTTTSIGYTNIPTQAYVDDAFDYAASQFTQLLNGKVNADTVGAASGVCPLDANSKVDSQYLPSYVDDVIEAYARSGQTALSQNWLATGSATGTVITPEAGKIYILMADSGDYAANTQFRWSGTTYVKMADGGVSSITNSEIDTIVAA